MGLKRPARVPRGTKERPRGSLRIVAGLAAHQFCSRARLMLAFRALRTAAKPMSRAGKDRAGDCTNSLSRPAAPPADHDPAVDIAREAYGAVFPGDPENAGPQRRATHEHHVTQMDSTRLQMGPIQPQGRLKSQVVRVGTREVRVRKPIRRAKKNNPSERSAPEARAGTVPRRDDRINRGASRLDISRPAPHDVGD